jgi:hypothetical protein
MSYPKIENWCLWATGNPYTAPECQSQVLVGQVYNHPVECHYDGKTIQTSRVQELDLKTGVAKTLNTTYKLGKPNEEWVEWLRENGYDKIEEFLSQAGS